LDPIFAGFAVFGPFLLLLLLLYDYRRLPVLLKKQKVELRVPPPECSQVILHIFNLAGIQTLMNALQPVPVARYQLPQMQLARCCHLREAPLPTLAILPLPEQIHLNWGYL
jgi:hypothetical protein